MNVPERFGGYPQDCREKVQLQIKKRGLLKEVDHVTAGETEELGTGRGKGGAALHRKCPRVASIRKKCTRPILV